MILPPVPPLPPMPQVTLPSLEETASVQNSVRVYSNTGGSVVSSGRKIEEGKSSVRAQVQTTLNGEKVVDIDRSETATGSASVVLEVKSSASSTGATSSVVVKKSSSLVRTGSRIKHFISYVFSLFSF